TTVTYIVTDLYGLTDECTFDVWIKNTDDPRFNVICPATSDFSVPADLDECGTDVTIPGPQIDNFCVEVYSASYQINGGTAVPVTVPAPVAGVSQLPSFTQWFDAGDYI